MKMRGIEGVVVVVLLLLVGVGFERCLGRVYRVGDKSGWTIGVDYSTWASSTTFLVGDTLGLMDATVFNYASGHTVDLVSHSDYSTCTIGNAITTDSSGTTTIPLKSPGPLFFICGVVGHCGSGMKLSITVVGAGSGSSSAAPASTTTNATTATTGSVPCTTAPNVYGIAVGTTPLMMSESPKIPSSLPVALLAVVGGVLVFQMMALR